MEGDGEGEPGAHALSEARTHLRRAREPVGDAELGGVEGDEQVDHREQIERRIERRVDDGQGYRLEHVVSKYVRK